MQDLLYNLESQKLKTKMKSNFTLQLYENIIKDAFWLPKIETLLPIFHHFTLFELVASLSLY